MAIQTPSWQQNILFKGLSEEEFQEIEKNSRQVQYERGTVVLKEGEKGESFSIIASGSLEVLKQGFRIHTLESGDVMGELAILGQEPRIASIVALEPCTVKEVLVSQLHTHLIDKLAKNLTFLFSTRLSITNQFTAQTLRKEVYQQKKRSELTKSAADSFIWIALYEVIAQQINSYLPSAYFPIFSSLYLPIMAYILSRDILKRGYPLSSFGLTWRNWKRSILETLLFTSPLFLLVVLLKKFFILTKAQYAGAELFRLGLEIPPSSLYDKTLLITAVVMYVLCCPVQEYIFRGIIQTLWQKFSLTRHRTFFAIVIASVFYLNVHFYWEFSPIVLLPSLIWGWLFARHRTIVGVGLGHSLLGFWMFYIVGF